jgi:hypothetical protein
MMQPLSEEGILHVWETGRDQHPVDQALTLLLAVDPEETRARLAEMSIAERDARLLDLRARTLGPTLAAFTRCRACSERLEFAVHTEQVVEPSPEGDAWEVEADGRTLRFRLPDSRDLAAAARCTDPLAARRMLAQRCILTVNERDMRGAEALSEAALVALAARMAEVAPQAEILCDLACPACGAQWQEQLDIASFFWTEVAVQAKRILREVDTIARTYHWSESEILAMSPMRRQSYLDLVYDG